MHITNLFIPLWILPTIGTIICFIGAYIIAEKKRYKGAWGGYVADLTPLIIWGVDIIIVLVMWMIYFAFT